MLNRKELISCAYLMLLDSILQKSEQTFMMYKCHKFAWRYISSLLMTSTRIGRIRHLNPQLFESAFNSGKFSIHYESGVVWTLNPDYFPIRWLQKMEPSSLLWIFKSVPSAMFSLLYFLDFSFKSYNVRAVLSFSVSMSDGQIWRRKQSRTGEIVLGGKI